MKKVLVPGLVAAIGMFAAGMVLSYLFNFLFPSVKAEYENTALFRPWSDPLMFLFFIQPFLLGVALAWCWNKIKTQFQGSVGIKAFNFTLIFLFISILPGMLMSVSCFKISLLMTLTWTISSFFQVWIASLIFMRMSK
jgi:uncharacterized Tic20 family protein